MVSPGVRVIVSPSFLVVVRAWLALPRLAALRLFTASTSDERQKLREGRRGCSQTELAAESGSGADRNRQHQSDDDEQRGG